MTGDRFADGKVLNAATIAVVAALTALTGLLVATSLRGAG
jgi:hypothetical protein